MPAEHRGQVDPSRRADRDAARRRGAGRDGRRHRADRRSESAIMHPTSHAFPANARAELGNPTLQRALGMARTGFPARRAQAVARLPEFEALREEGRAIKDHTLAHLDFYLELYERNVEKAGGHVHWARNADEARNTVLDICRAAGAKIVT